MRSLSRLCERRWGKKCRSGALKGDDKEAQERLCERGDKRRKRWKRREEKRREEKETKCEMEGKAAVMTLECNLGGGNCRMRCRAWRKAGKRSML